MDDHHLFSRLRRKKTGCAIADVVLLRERQNRMLELLSGDEEQFAFGEVERNAQGFEYRLLAAERGAKAQSLVGKGPDMFNFFSGEHHRQGIVLIHIARKTCYRLAIDSASDKRPVRLRAER